MSSPTVVFFRPNNPIAALVNEKKRVLLRPRAALLTILKRANLRTLFACLYVETNRVAFLPYGPSPVVRTKTRFNWRESNDGLPSIRKVPTTIFREFGRLLSNDRTRRARRRALRLVSPQLIETRANLLRQLSSRSSNRDGSR